jgi:glycosyltransferase involved in cell wall biosynthesis
VKVFFWAADTTGSGHYRMALPAMGMAWLGHQVAASTHLTGDWQGFADTIVGARVALPSSSVVWRRLHSRGVRLVLDLDDDYWSIDPQNESAARQWTPNMLSSLAANMQLADVVTVVSERLAQVAREHAGDTPVVVVPNALPAQFMGNVRNYADRPIRVGWAGTSSTVHDLSIAAHALKKAADRDDVEVRLVGIRPDMAIRAGVKHDRISTFGWLATQDYFNVVQTFDVWVAPYRDNAFNRSKFATKALEAGMMGIPLLVSGIEPYRQWITHDVDGILIRRDHEWTSQLRRVLDDEALRKRLGDAGRGRAAPHILQQVNQQWEAVCRPI